MYFLEFLKRLPKQKHKISLFIHFILSIIVTVLVMELLWYGIVMVPDVVLHTHYTAIEFNEYVLAAIAVVVYFLGLFIALSPAGESILCALEGGSKIEDPALANYINSILKEVLSNAKALHPEFDTDVTLYVIDGESANAFAIGRKKILISQGMFSCTTSQAKAILAHEVGHLVNKDTDILLAIKVGNLFLTLLLGLFELIWFCLKQVISLVFSVLQVLFSGVAFLGCLSVSLWIVMALVIFSAALYFGLGVALPALFMFGMFFLFVKVIEFIWNVMCESVIRSSLKENEFAADEFAWECGYGDDLYTLITDFGNSGTGDADGFALILGKAHPKKKKRLAKLEALGARYIDEFASAQMGDEIIGSYRVVEEEVVSNPVVEEVIEPTLLENQSSKPARKFCPYCGTPTVNGGRFCGGCGAELK